jgi:hypothetical protein
LDFRRIAQNIFYLLPHFMHILFSLPHCHSTDRLQGTTDVHSYFIFGLGYLLAFHLAATKLDKRYRGHRNKRLHETNEQHVLRLFFIRFSFLQLAKKERGQGRTGGAFCDLFLFLF